MHKISDDALVQMPVYIPFSAKEQISKMAGKKCIPRNQLTRAWLMERLAVELKKAQA